MGEIGLVSILALLLAATAGFAVAWLLLSARVRSARESNMALEATLRERESLAGARAADLAELRRDESHLREANGRLAAELDAERRGAAEKLAAFADAEAKLREAFAALSSEALRRNNQSFLELARESLERFQQAAQDDLTGRQKAIGDLVEPVKSSLTQMDGVLREMEKGRAAAFEALQAQVRAMTDAQERLRTETAGLATALKSPSARGRWGEVQLRRVVELAGMEEHCDFVEQQALAGAGRPARPDLQVRLPGGRVLVVDAKTPLLAYLEAAEAGDETLRQRKLDEHARQVKARVTELSARSYWDGVEAVPDFVVLFLPGEAFFAEAARRDPGLVEFALERKVLLTSPATLIALLKAAHYGWQQERLADNAQKVRDLGAELYERLAVLSAHMTEVGEQIERTAEVYDRAVGSFERRVVASARKLKELGAGTSREVESPKAIGRSVRRIDGIDASIEELEAEEGHA